MSAERKARFGNLARLKGAEPALPTTQAPPPPEPVEPERVQFGSKLRTDLKMKLKVASGYERRTQVEILEEIIEKYLQERHPNL